MFERKASVSSAFQLLNQIVSPDEFDHMVKEVPIGLDATLVNSEVISVWNATLEQLDSLSSEAGKSENTKGKKVNANILESQYIVPMRKLMVAMRYALQVQNHIMENIGVDKNEEVESQLLLLAISTFNVLDVAKQVANTLKNINFKPPSFLSDRLLLAVKQADLLFNDEIEANGKWHTLANLNTILNYPDDKLLDLVTAIVLNRKKLLSNPTGSSDDSGAKYALVFVTLTAAGQLPTDIIYRYLKDDLLSNSQVDPFLTFSKALIIRLRQTLHNTYQLTKKERLSPNELERIENFTRSFFLVNSDSIGLSVSWVLGELGVTQYGDLWKMIRVFKTAKSSDPSLNDVSIEVVAQNILDSLGNEDILELDSLIGRLLRKIARDLPQENESIEPSDTRLLNIFHIAPSEMLFHQGTNDFPSSFLLLTVEELQIKKVLNTFEITLVLESGVFRLTVNTKTGSIDWNRAVPFDLASAVEKSAVNHLLQDTHTLISQEIEKRKANKLLPKVSAPLLVSPQKGPRREKNDEENVLEFSTPVGSRMLEVLSRSHAADLDVSNQSEEQSGDSFEVLATNLEQAASLIPAGFSKERVKKLISKLNNIKKLQVKQLDDTYKGRLCYTYRLSLSLRVILVACNNQEKGVLATEILLIDFRDRVYDEFKKKIQA